MARLPKVVEWAPDGKLIVHVKVLVVSLIVAQILIMVVLILTEGTARYLILLSLSVLFLFGEFIYQKLILKRRL